MVRKRDFQKEMLQSSPGVKNDVEVFSALREDPRNFVVHCTSTGASAIVGQSWQFLVIFGDIGLKQASHIEHISPLEASF